MGSPQFTQVAIRSAVIRLLPFRLTRACSCPEGGREPPTSPLLPVAALTRARFGAAMGCARRVRLASAKSTAVELRGRGSATEVDGMGAEVEGSGKLVDSAVKDAWRE